MAQALCAYIKEDRPFLGICLGLQLLFESSTENGLGQTTSFLVFPVASSCFWLKTTPANNEQCIRALLRSCRNIFLLLKCYDGTLLFDLTMRMFLAVDGLGIIPGVVRRFDSSGGLTVPHIGWNALNVREGSHILDDIGNRHVYFVHSYRATPVGPSSSFLWALYDTVTSMLSDSFYCLPDNSQVKTWSGYRQCATMEKISLPLSEGEMCMLFNFIQRRVEVTALSPYGEILWMICMCCPENSLDQC